MEKNSGKTANKICAACLLGLAALIMGICIGSVSISLPDTLNIIGAKLFGLKINDSIEASHISILWDIRIPRALCAFLVGAALSVSGAIIQAILQNPLASSYTLGVSSGASLGAAVIIISGISSSVLGFMLLPVVGFICGFLTVLLVILIAGRLDTGFQNHTIILFGMIFSLFVNAMLTMLSSLSHSHMQRLILWQMGSFSGRKYKHVLVILVVFLIGIVLTIRYCRELDILTVGDEGAMALGVDAKKTKKRLLIIASLLTGIAVCFTGVIGFVDLAVPHVVRKVFGSSHKVVIPMAAIVGGAMMSVADLLARTLLAPQEIPVGAITALFGAPFFLFVYFKERS